MQFYNIVVIGYRIVKRGKPLVKQCVAILGEKPLRKSEETKKQDTIERGATLFVVIRFGKHWVEKIEDSGDGELQLAREFLTVPLPIFDVKAFLPLFLRNRVEKPVPLR
jgi:hypothetical protein